MDLEQNPADRSNRTAPPNPIQSYFRRPVPILGFIRPAWNWMLGSLAATALLAGLAIGVIANSRHLFIPPVAGWTGAACLAVAFVLLFLVLLRSLFTNRLQFTIFALILSGIAFFANAYVLDHGVFPPFTPRTTAALWLSFAAMAVSVFANRLPVPVRHILLPLLTFGGMLCLAFVIVLAPFMIFSWALVWAGGLGFLPYSPLFAMISFTMGAREIYRTLSAPKKHRMLARFLLGSTIGLVLAYSAYYKIQWDRAATILTKPVLESGANRIDGDLPEWVQRAARFPVNHVSEMVLQPDRTSDISIFDLQSLFDPLAFLSSTGLSGFAHSRQSRMVPEDSGKMLHLLFHQPFAHLDRLWRGTSLVTTDMNSHVQLHPDLRVAYTETTIAIFNERTDEGHGWFGIRNAGLSNPEEAIYTIRLPEGSICTKLSLWIDGEERTARLTFNSRARNAYQAIVNRRRDPSYVEWLDGNRLRLRVFPVQPGMYRTVRIGIVSPLREEGGRLHYERMQMEGPDDVGSQDVRVDLFGADTTVDSKGIWLSEQVVPDGQVRQFTGHFARSTWSLSLPARPPAGTVSAGGKSYEVLPLQMEKQDFAPSAILVALNGSLPRSRWKAIVARLYDFQIPVYLLTDEWFYTADREKAIAYIDTVELPSFNLFPLSFPAKRHMGNALWVVAGEEQSIPFGELRGSPRFDNTLENAQKNMPVVLINGKRSEYVESLIDLHRLVPVAQDEAGLIRILKDRAIHLPLEDESNTPLPLSALTLHQVDQADALPGSDLLVRLLIHRRLMKALGQRFFDRDLQNEDLVQLARDGMIVSPVSSLIVLESEKDYKRFGIEKDRSALGQSKLEAPGGVPEPHEIALLITTAIAALLYLRARRGMVHAH